jgi:hypothetical protein
MSSVAGARLGVVVLLLVAAYFAAAPWLGCISSLRAGFFAIPHVDVTLVRICTFGGGVPNPPGFEVPGFTGPYWGNLVVGIFYVVAAIVVARRRRPL